MKLFPWGLATVTQALRHPASFLFEKNSTPKLSPVYATASKSTVKICEEDLLEVTALKGSGKGAMNNSFRNAPYTKLLRKYVIDLL